jgi:hypothetical protein
MIQQVITCDICGAQKHQANHWFVACEESGELRIRGWNSLQMLSPVTKHLCGETCAHKLVSKFLMMLVEAGSPRAGEKGDTLPAAEATISARAESAAPPPSTWQVSQSAQRSPGSPDHAHLKRSHPCTGSR